MTTAVTEFFEKLTTSEQFLIAAGLVVFTMVVGIAGIFVGVRFFANYKDGGRFVSCFACVCVCVRER